MLELNETYSFNSLEINENEYINVKPKEIVSEIIQNLKKGDTKVKTHGEVMTPIWLVEDMLNALPNEIWSNPNLKWLDPCSGIGVFFTIVLERLMEGLCEFEHNEELRYKHIIENMLWACEIQEDKVRTYCKIFNHSEKYKLNIHIGSYLEWETKNFDVIVMNPPYQVLKEGNKKSQPLWDKFVIKTFSDLVEGGYLVAVHPDGWRAVSGAFKGVQNLLKSRQMLYLELHDVRDGLKTFDVQIPYDFYCIHNVSPTFHTKIKCSDETTQMIDISKREFIPNGMFEEFDNLIVKGNEERVNLIQDSTYHTQSDNMSKRQIEDRVSLIHSRSLYGSDKKNMSKEQTNGHIFPCVYTTTKDGSVNLWWSNVDKGHFGIPKVIFTNGSATHPIIDKSGNYGLTQFAYGIVDSPENLPYIQKALLNPKFLNLISFSDGLTDGGRHRYNPKVIALFRKDFWKEFI